MKMISPEGKTRKIHFERCSFFGHAWVRVGLFKKINQYAAGTNAIDNLVKRLESEGWKVLSE